MDDTIKKAEELLEERARQRKPNGHAPAEEPAEGADGAAGDPGGDPDLAMKRLAADFANYRKRNEAERADFARYAKADLVRRLLDVLDGFDRAIGTVPEELRAQPWVEGMALVERKLRQVLDAEGLLAIEAVGQPFDPYIHEAVAHLGSDLPEGTVISEFQKGYRLHDRVIRPAVVAVSKGKED